MRSEVVSSQLLLHVLMLWREKLSSILDPLKSLMGEALVDEYNEGLSIGWTANYGIDPYYSRSHGSHIQE